MYSLPIAQPIAQPIAHLHTHLHTRPRPLRLALGSLLLCLLTAGCRVSSHNHGKDNNVEIGTPFGSMHVKTDASANLAGLGVTPYPGATPYKDDGDDNNSHAADVNMNFGSFHLGVKAASYMSHDSQDQILAFYRKDLARYGEVIQCVGSAPVGQPQRTGQGLTCSDDNKAGHSYTHADAEVQLRAGSPQHQHIVALEEHGGGQKIGLVALDLPGHFGSTKYSEE